MQSRPTHPESTDAGRVEARAPASRAPIAFGSEAGPAAGASLAGVRVAVVGAGDVLARALGQLQRLGSACVVLDDPYHAASEFGQRPGGYGALVLCLPCCYADELGVIGAVLRCSPGTRVIVAAADQQVSMLTAAIRLGATGVLTESGVEWIGMPEPAQSAHAFPTRESLVRAHEPSAESVVEAGEEGDPGEDQHDDESALEPVDPVLSAEELHALLHDEPVVEHKSSGSATGGGRR